MSVVKVKTTELYAMQSLINKSSIFFPIVLAISFCLLTSCDNPADKTPDAVVSEPLASKDTASAPEPEQQVVDATKYVITPESKIGFIGSKVTGSHEGGFEKFQGHFTLADGQLHGTDHTIIIDMNSTWADHPKLLEHLRSEDFFHVEKFPEARFAITSIEQQEGDNYQVAGDFTLHGVTKNIAFPATISKEEEKVMIRSEFDINRFDFEIRYPGMSDDLIRKEVVIKLDLVVAPEA